MAVCGSGPETESRLIILSLFFPSVWWQAHDAWGKRRNLHKFNPTGFPFDNHNKDNSNISYSDPREDDMEVNYVNYGNSH